MSKQIAGQQFTVTILRKTGSDTFINSFDDTYPLANVVFLEGEIMKKFPDLTANIDNYTFELKQMVRRERMMGRIYETPIPNQYFFSITLNDENMLNINFNDGGGAILFITLIFQYLSETKRIILLNSIPQTMIDDFYNLYINFDLHFLMHILLKHQNV